MQPFLQDDLFMKRIIHIAFLLLYCFAFKFSFAQKDSLFTYKKYFDHQLKNWTTSVTGFNLAGFKKIDSVSFEDMYYRTFDNMNAYFSLYKTIINFSPDSSQFIDIYDGLNLERHGNKIISVPDAEETITLCNLQTKKWERILFLGTSIGIQDVCWINNKEFILAGYEMDTNNKMRPLLYIGNILQKKFILFEDKKALASVYETAQYKKLRVDQ
jgi:hypothetical protein